jgi:hypothetical protein
LADTPSRHPPAPNPGLAMPARLPAHLSIGQRVSGTRRSAVGHARDRRFLRYVGRALLLLGACTAATEAFAQAVAPPPVAFDGFGLDGFSGAGSVAAALRAAGPTRDAAGATLPFAIAVRGPTDEKTATSPLAAELRSRLDRIDVAAGVRADPDVLRDGPAQWTGRIAVTSEGEQGTAAVELRTTLGRWETDGRLGVELGPRIERRLRRGRRFFIDGKAEAQAVRSTDGGWWALPGTTAADGAGMLGVMARTGIVL